MNSISWNEGIAVDIIKSYVEYQEINVKTDFGVRKAINYIAVQNGYPGNLKSQILDVVSAYHIERVESKKLKKAAKKIYKEVQDEKN